MSIDEDFEIPTFLPPKPAGTGLVDLEVKCPICDARRTFLFAPNDPDARAFADLVSDLWGVVCEDCQTLAVNFCEEKSVDMDTEEFQWRIFKKDQVLVGMMKRYRADVLGLTTMEKEEG